MEGAGARVEAVRLSGHRKSADPGEWMEVFLELAEVLVSAVGSALFYPP